MTPITHICGCVNVRDPEWLAIKNVSKCKAHISEQLDPAQCGYEYYERHGIFGNAPHVAEFFDGFAERPLKYGGGDIALEVGCGASMYPSVLKGFGYKYLGIDASPWACQWVADKYKVETQATTFEEFNPPDWPGAGLILAAHVVEHLQDAPAALRKMRVLLKPGGLLYLIIPNGVDDELNPDHQWFVDCHSLVYILERVGFTDIQWSIKRRIQRERFLYVSGVALA